MLDIMDTMWNIISSILTMEYVLYIVLPLSLIIFSIKLFYHMLGFRKDE